VTDTEFHSVQVAYTSFTLALHTVRADGTAPSYISAVLLALPEMIFPQF